MLICSYNPVATLLEDSIGTLNTEYSCTGTCWRNRRTDAIDGVCSVFCVECSVHVFIHSQDVCIAIRSMCSNQK